MSNGLSADGHTCYGLSTASNEPGLIEFNDALNTPGFEFDGMHGRIVIGENNTDTLYYDTVTKRWESCDRIGTENVWESCDTLAELIEAKIKLLKIK
ncbi:MAG: YrhA family protein [Mixta sp.]|nr:YrhA family protein [Mixta sp.]MCR1567950.1 YrhA family protein [Mixta sp.]